MSIPFSGTITRSKGVIDAVTKQLKLMSLKPVTKITVQFDPFYDKVKETRLFVHYISARKVTKTNLSCVLKTNIVCDNSEPTVTCDLSNGDKVLFKCANLNAVDILKAYNKHISVLAPPEPEPVHTGRLKKLKKRRPKIRISRHRR